MQMADLMAARTVKPLHEVGEDAVDTGVGCVQPLIAALRKQQLARFTGKRREGAEPFRGAAVGKIEMQPQPAAVGIFDLKVGQQRKRRAVGLNVEGPDETRNDAKVALIPGTRIGVDRETVLRNRLVHRPRTSG